MRFKILFPLLICLFFMNTASADTWVSNSSIVTGLGDIGFFSAPAVFNDSGTWKLISGEQYGNFIGYQWNGATWVPNSSIVAGLVSNGGVSTPTVFNDAGTWKLIAGEDLGDFFGYYWNGTSWVPDSSIVAGLPDLLNNAAPEVYYDSGTWKLISGQYWGIFYSYQWNGTSWVGNSSIKNGLPKYPDGYGTCSTPAVFNNAGTWKLITGNNTGDFTGFQWNGTAWLFDSSIVNGLGNVGYLSTPEVFNDSGTWKMIAGESDGFFNGYQWNNAPVTSSLKTESQTNPIQIHTNITTPYFTWTYSDVNSDTQTHWQVWVGTSLGASDKWDSTQLSGTDTSDTYAGSSLSGGVTYYVQVRTNDSYEWSEWTTGTFIVSTPAPINIANTTGIAWINWTFAACSGDINTDSLNISVSTKGWTNGSSDLYHNATSLSLHTDYTINIYAYNATYGLSYLPLTDTATTLNAPILQIISTDPTGNFDMETADSQILTSLINHPAITIWYIDGTESHTDYNSTTPDYYFTSSETGTFNITMISNNSFSEVSYTWFVDVTIVEPHSVAAAYTSYKSPVEPEEEKVNEEWMDYLDEEILDEEILDEEILDEKGISGSVKKIAVELKGNFQHLYYTYCPEMVKTILYRLFR